MQRHLFSILSMGSRLSFFVFMIALLGGAGSLLLNAYAPSVPFYGSPYGGTPGPFPV